MIYFSFRRIDKTYLKNKVLNAYHLEKQDYSPKNNTKKKKTEKAEKWLHGCGRKDFNSIEQIKKDAYICSLYFVGQKGPTEEHPFCESR